MKYLIIDTIKRILKIELFFALCLIAGALFAGKPILQFLQLHWVAFCLLGLIILAYSIAKVIYHNGQEYNIR